MGQEPTPTPDAEVPADVSTVPSTPAEVPAETVAPVADAVQSTELPAEPEAPVSAFAPPAETSAPAPFVMPEATTPVIAPAPIDPALQASIEARQAVSTEPTVVDPFAQAQAEQKLVEGTGVAQAMSDSILHPTTSEDASKSEAA